MQSDVGSLNKLEAEKIVLAIDPGTDKCGLCLVKRISDKNLDLLFHDICPVASIEAFMHQAYSVAEYSLVIVGSGTGSKKIVHQIREAFPSMGLLLLDEKDTTLEAREKFWEYNPRRGWRRLLPSSLQVPPVPIDDFAALVLAERVLLEH